MSAIFSKTSFNISRLLITLIGFLSSVINIAHRCVHQAKKMGEREKGENLIEH